MLGGANRVTWNKPQGLICYICGREYGTSSLKIHLPQCAKLWEERESQKHPRERRPVPSRPPGFNLESPTKGGRHALEQQNAEAFKAYNERALVPCPNCARTFLEDRLVVHLRSCKPGQAARGVGTRTSPEKLGGGGGGAGMVAQPGLSRPTTSAGRNTLTSPQSGPKSVGFSSQSPASSSESRPATAAQPPGLGRTVSVLKSPGVGAGGGAVFSERPVGSESKRMAGTGTAYFPGDSADGDDGDGAPTGPLVACSLCGRNFAADRVAKHEAVCATRQAKEAKRAAKVAKAQAKLPQNQPHADAGKKTRWREQANELRQAMRAARQVKQALAEGRDLRSLPPPKPAENPDYVGCPHCGRRFNQMAASRHIPKCATTINRPKPPPQLRSPVGYGSTSSSFAAPSMTSPGHRAPQMRPLAGAGAQMAASGYGAMSSPTSRPTTGSADTRRTMAKSAAKTATTRLPNRAAAPGGGAGASSSSSSGAPKLADLQSQLAYLTQTVQQLAGQQSLQASHAPPLGRQLSARPGATLGMGSAGGGGGAGGGCGRCGSGRLSGANFCPNCGSRY